MSRVPKVLWRLLSCVGLCVAVAACPTTDPAPNLKTVDDYCGRACTAPMVGPCEGIGTNATCKGDCAKNASGHSDACNLCLASRSGFQWSTCDCDPPCNFATDPGCLPASRPCVVCVITTAHGEACTREASCTIAPTCFGQYLATTTPAGPSDGGTAPPPPDCSDVCR